MAAWRTISEFALLVLLAGVALPAASADGIEWVEDWGTLLETAEAQDRLLLVDFYTSWCTYCDALEKEAFGDPRVVALAREHFACGRLDAEVQRAATMRYRPEGYPTVVFATPSGEEILRFSGYRSPDQVHTIVELVVEVGPRMAAWLERIEADRRDFEAHAGVAETFLELGLGERAAHFARRARKLAEAPQEEERAAFLETWTDCRRERERACRKGLDRLAERVGAEDQLTDYLSRIEQSLRAHDQVETADHALSLRP
jgi:thioredoxin-related protein